jgi:hypothetical protein
VADPDTTLKATPRLLLLEADSPIALDYFSGFFS